MIKVYGLPNSRSDRAQWVLDEVGQDYEFHKIDFASGEQRGPQYLSLNPASKVPALVDGDLVLTESGAIINYVCKVYGTHMIPSDPAERAYYDRWCYFALTELEQGLWTMGKHKFALPKEQRVKEIFPTAAWEYQKALGLFSEGLGDQPYILGENISGADILLAHTLNWGVAFDQPLEQENLQQYRERCNARDSYARMRERQA